jgi:hypothetical protein
MRELEVTGRYVSGRGLHPEVRDTKTPPREGHGGVFRVGGLPSATPQADRESAAPKRRPAAQAPVAAAAPVRVPEKNPLGLWDRSVNYSGLVKARTTTKPAAPGAAPKKSGNAVTVRRMEASGTQVAGLSQKEKLKRLERYDT